MTDDEIIEKIVVDMQVILERNGQAMICSHSASC